MVNEILQCDFCSMPGPVWRYPARSCHLSRPRPLHVRIGLQIVVVRPVLRAAHHGVTLGDAQGLGAFGGMRRHHFSTLERIALLKGSNELRRRPGGSLGALRQKTTAGIALLPLRHVAVPATRAIDRKSTRLNSSH